MSKRSRFFAFLAALCLSSVCSSAQQSAPDKKPAAATAAEDRGLLLGMYFTNAATWDELASLSTGSEKWTPGISKEPHGKYLTLWISRSGNAVKIQPVEGLLVPRASGFWHVGTSIVTSDQDPDFNYDEQFWATAAGQKPKPSGTDAQVDGASVRLITYVGPDYLSYLFHWQGGAGSWEYVYPHVASLDDLATETAVQQVLGPAAGAEFKRVAKPLDHMNDEPGANGEPCNCCTIDDKEWGILHVGDSWQSYARFHYGTSSSCAQGSDDRWLKAMLPRTVAPGGKLNKTWDALRKDAEAVSKSDEGAVR